MAKHEVFNFREIPSTQDEARKHLARVTDVDDFVWVRADSQSAGRGRQGRSFVSTSQQLLVSALFRLPAQAENAQVLRKPLLSLIAGQALYLALKSDRLFLKWPNDLYAFDDRGQLKKLAGILAESAGADFFVVGWGVNLRAAPPELSQAASLEQITGHAPTATELLEALQMTFASLLKEWRREGRAFEAHLIRALEKKSMAPLWGLKGEVLSGAQVVAEAVGLEADGRLIVQELESGARRSLSAGEFRLLNNSRDRVSKV